MIGRTTIYSKAKSGPIFHLSKIQIVLTNLMIQDNDKDNNKDNRQRQRQRQRQTTKINHNDNDKAQRQSLSLFFSLFNTTNTWTFFQLKRVALLNWAIDRQSWTTK